MKMRATGASRHFHNALLAVLALILAMSHAVSAAEPQSRSAIPTPAEIQRLLLLEDDGRARELLTQMSGSNPQQVWPYLQLSALAARQNDAQSARQAAQRAYFADPFDPEAVASRHNPPNPDESSRLALEEALVRQPQTPALYFALGNLHAMHGRWTAARQAYRQALALRPVQADYLFNLAISEEHCGQAQAARSSYQAALVARRLNPAVFSEKAARERIELLEAAHGKN